MNKRIRKEKKMSQIFATCIFLEILWSLKKLFLCQYFVPGFVLKSWSLLPLLSQFLSKLELRPGTSSNVSSFEASQVKLKPKCLGLSSFIFAELKVYPKASSYFFKWARALPSFKKRWANPGLFLIYFCLFVLI